MHHVVYIVLPRGESDVVTVYILQVASIVRFNEEDLSTSVTPSAVGSQRACIGHAVHLCCSRLVLFK